MPNPTLPISSRNKKISHNMSRMHFLNYYPGFTRIYTEGTSG
jgi:hypothetical protein